MFAVSCALVADGAGAGARADGVTLLPVGEKWLALAMECAGAGASRLTHSVGGTLSKDEVREMETKREKDGERERRRCLSLESFRFCTFSPRHLGILIGCSASTFLWFMLPSPSRLDFTSTPSHSYTASLTACLSFPLLAFCTPAVSDSRAAESAAQPCWPECGG